MNKGYCGIGVENIKTGTNLGTLWRSAYGFGADFIFTIGRRYKFQSSDTVKAYRHIPLYNFIDFDDFYKHMPYDCPLVGIEITDKAQPLETFKHPDRAIYLLGAEDHGISKKALSKCRHIVKFTSDRCLNVASAGTVILYDRQLKKVLNLDG